MERWDGRIAVVFDFAGSSTGLAICKDLVKHGMTVFGLTKHEGIRAMQVLQKQLNAEDVKGKLFPFECDVREEASVMPVFRWIGDHYGGIDLLINNANGMTKGLILDDNNTAALRQTMETNIMGLCMVTREAVKLMKMRPPEKKNIGHIINITSTVGQKTSLVQTKPINALYPASRHSAKAITECVRQELIYMDQNVKVTAISPGLVESDGITTDMENEPTLLASEVSAAVLYAISVKPHVQIEEIVLKPVGDFL